MDPRWREGGIRHQQRAPGPHGICGVQALFAVSDSLIATTMFAGRARLIIDGAASRGQPAGVRGEVFHCRLNAAAA